MLIRMFIPYDLQPDMDCPLDVDMVHYLRVVMRQKEGGKIILFDGRGGEYLADIVSLEHKSGDCHTVQFHDVCRELPLHAHIIQAANRSEKIEHVLQKGTELGAAAFTVCMSERMQLRLQGSKLDKRLQRWQKIIIEAAEQSGRTCIPTLQWLPRLTALPTISRAAYYLHPEGNHGLGEYFPVIQHNQTVTLAVGPEGGWSSRDMKELQERNFEPLCFGPRVMRTETAAPALLAALQALEAVRE
ncbi:MAG: 16S rRNA (uracil(1498)-N(3))-methyltransferase [Mariprofundaceae bacterium]|nr:16S rRNA (uracil(1498)-N(3))-methyltransferase [Mariprofundaceae bacterium]